MAAALRVTHQELMFHLSLYDQQLNVTSWKPVRCDILVPRWGNELPNYILFAEFHTIFEKCLKTSLQEIP